MMSRPSRLPADRAALLPEPGNSIAGRLVPGGGPRHADLYPASAETLCEVAWSSAADVDAAVEAATAGFETWRRTPPAARARVLRRTADLLRERLEPIARLETLDTGKPIQETLAVDVVSAADCLDYFAAQAAVMTGEHVPFGGAGGDWGYVAREPLGVGAGIGAWNYPLQVAAWKSAPALACGNAFVFKPAETTPLTALRLAEAFRDAGLPEGVFNVVQGGPETGAALVAHPGIAKVSLTGETTTGIKILKGAADTLKHVTLELGGKSPLVIFEDADLDAAVGGAMVANFYSTGQVCSNGTRVFVHEAIRKPFLERLVERTRALTLGDPLDPATQIGPLVSAEHFAKVMAYYQAAPAQGEVLVGGGAAHVPGFEAGWWVQPTILSIEDDAAPIAREEVFGPLMAVLPFRDEEEVVARANDTGYGLSAGVYTADMARAHRMIGRLRAGTCWINSYNVTPVELPFGGVRRSGIGRENGRWALDAWSEPRSVYVAMTPMASPY